jgi:hypothetical protein
MLQCSIARSFVQCNNFFRCYEAVWMPTALNSAVRLCTSARCTDWRSQCWVQAIRFDPSALKGLIDAMPDAALNLYQRLRRLSRPRGRRETISRWEIGSAAMIGTTIPIGQPAASVDCDGACWRVSFRRIRPPIHL